MKINYDEKVGAVIVAFMFAVMFSWVPWLVYSIIASVFPLPAAEWQQVTFFTWVGLTLLLWIKS